VQAALLLIITILAAGFYLVGYIVTHQGMPSTAQEKVVLDARGAYYASPRDASLAASYAQALSAAGQLDKATGVIEEFRSVEATSPAPQVTVEEARIAWLRKDIESALRHLETATIECEDLREFRLDEMTKAGLTMKVEVPELVDVQLLRAKILEEEGRTADAAEALTAALAENPLMADVLVWRGDLTASLGDTEAARADYERSRQLVPVYEPAVNGLGALDG
jgi:tetratricopeptide (TPR) repeat protein